MIFQCEKCNFAAVKKEKLRCHMEAVHRVGDYKCGECHFTAVKREELRSHVEAVQRD